MSKACFICFKAAVSRTWDKTKNVIKAVMYAMPQFHTYKIPKQQGEPYKFTPRMNLTFDPDWLKKDI